MAAVVREEIGRFRFEIGQNSLDRGTQGSQPWRRHFRPPRESILSATFAYGFPPLRKGQLYPIFLLERTSDEVPYASS